MRTVACHLGVRRILPQLTLLYARTPLPFLLRLARAGARHCCAETPAQPVGSQIYFQDTGVSSTEINWVAPSTGTYNAPILGYKLQMKQLCALGNVAINDRAGSAITGATLDALTDCTANYVSGFTEPVTATIAAGRQPAVAPSRALSHVPR